MAFNLQEFSRTYWLRHPNQAFIVGSVITLLLTPIFSIFAFDSLLEGVPRVVCGVTLLALFGITAHHIYKKTRIFRVVAIGTLVLMLVATASVYFFYIKKLPQGTGESARAAEATLVSTQETAFYCASRHANLFVQHGRRRSTTNGHPEVGHTICENEKNVWELLPPGWTYGKVTDEYTGDGTFTFVAYNRAGDHVTCTETGCVLEDRTGSTTKLSATVLPSFSYALPEDRTIRVGEEATVATIALHNDDDDPIDLQALWFHRTGTAPPSALEMVLVSYGDRTYGENYHLSLLPRARGGSEYIDQPDMFVIKPGETRVYDIKIQLASTATQYKGTTIGLNFDGFSYKGLVAGMRFEGALLTIE